MSFRRDPRRIIFYNNLVVGQDVAIEDSGIITRALQWSRKVSISLVHCKKLKSKKKKKKTTNKGRNLMAYLNK